jgi:hypothetical protein
MNDEAPSTFGKQLLAQLFDRADGARGDTMRDLLSAVWSFLRQPTVLEDRVVEVEERLSAVEKRIVRDLKAGCRGRVFRAGRGVRTLQPGCIGTAFINP